MNYGPVTVAALPRTLSLIMDLIAPAAMRCDVAYFLQGNSAVVNCRGRHGRSAMVKLMLS